MQSISPTRPIRLGTARHAMAALIGFGATAARFAARRGHQPSATPRRAFILEPYGLGDAISLVPLVRGLLAYEWQVTVCARNSWRDLFPAEISWLDCRLPWTAYDDREKYRAVSLIGPAMRSFLRDLRKAAAGSVGLDTRGDTRNLLLLRLARCGRVLTLDHYLAYDLATPARAAEPIAYDGALRRWQSNLRFLTALVPEADPARFPLDLRSHWPAPPGAAGPPVAGLIPLAPWQGKLWPRDSWQTTIALLRQDGWLVRGLAGPGQLEATAAALGLDHHDVALCPDLASWARQLSILRAVVSVDTGPMHLADALGVPLVALYGAGTLPLWAPSGRRSLALHRQNDPDFAPVHPTNAGIALGQEWMRRHTPDDVAAAVRTVTAATPA